MASVNPYSVTRRHHRPMPPPYRYRRSFAGPIILILIGLLFLMKNLGFRFPLWHWFGHWWPLLLILWGVIILVENVTSTSMGYRTRRLGAGGVLLMVLLVIARRLGALHLRLQLQLGRPARPVADGRRPRRHVRHRLYLRGHAGAVFSGEWPRCASCATAAR